MRGRGRVSGGGTQKRLRRLEGTRLRGGEAAVLTSRMSWMVLDCTSPKRERERERERERGRERGRLCHG